MNKIYITLVFLALLLSACGGDSKHTYEMELRSGETITVEYDYCIADSERVNCWNNWNGSRSTNPDDALYQPPDASYFAITFEVVE